MIATATPAAPARRSKAGRKPKDAGGRRTKQARATLNDPERARHEAWLRTQGWPAVPEVDIVRAALAEKWATVPHQRAA